MLSKLVSHPESMRQQLEAEGLNLQRLAEIEKKVSLIPEEGLGQELEGTLARLIVIGRQQLTEELLEKAKSAPLTDLEKQQLKEILQSRESI